MQKKIKKMFGQTETYVFLIIVLLALMIQVRSGQFFTGNNIVDLVTALIVPGLFACGTFMVLVSGGIDVAFPALASLCAYATTKLFLDMSYTGSVLLPLLFAIVLGALLGAFNGYFIGYLNLNALIVTLGTSSMFKGFMQGALDSKQLAVIPEGMRNFGTGALLTAPHQTQHLDELIKYCTIIVTTVPILVVYPFAQKYFVTGVMIGSVKG